MTSPLSDFIADTDRETLLHEWNNTSAPLPDAPSMHHFIEAQVDLQPYAIALWTAESKLTYAELDGHANVLAFKLRENGVTRETLVGICAERRAETIVAILAILKAGGAYVPIDPKYPSERITYILKDAKAPILLTQRHYATHAGETRTIFIDDALSTSAGRLENINYPEDLAYVIYTSGSTGQPKGVAIEHRNAIALIGWAQTVYQPEDLAGVLFSTSICFDLSIFEIFVTLASGGSIILAENALDLRDHPHRERITLINTVPSAISELIDAELVPNNVKIINLAGEALATSLVDRIYASTQVEKVYDLYGPSEDTTYSTYALRKAGMPATIGKPISNTRAYVLDPCGRLLPPGVPGELYLAGAGLARGYLHRPELTAEKFIPNPFDPTSGSRLYRTGDRVRYFENGDLQFLGRLDHQVKIRGHRIELGEIETALESHLAVEQAIVHVHNGRLIGYLRPPNRRDAADSTGIWRHLATRLPDYMIPSNFVLMENFPLTPNGKVDRKALPVPAEEEGQPTSSETIGPRDKREAQLVEIWKQVLGKSNIGIEDDIFELSGDSILIFQLITRANRAGIELTPKQVFRLRTIAAISAEAATANIPAKPAVATIQRVNRDASIAPPMEVTLAFPASVPQQVFWYLEMLQPGVTAFNVPLRFHLEGPLRVDLLEKTINAIIDRHEILRSCFAEQNGELLQVVQPEMTIALPLIDLSHLPDSQQQDEVDRLGSIEARRPFRLSIHPMIRAELLRLSATLHIFHLTIHHALFDGISMTVFTGEMCRIYQSLLEKRPNPLDPLPIQYGDFSVWQKEYLKGPEVAKQLQYWKNKLDGMTELELPSDRPRPSVKSWKGDIISTLLPRKLTDRLQSIAARHSASLFHLDLAAFKILLHRYTGTTNIAIGTPVTGRNREELEPLMGVFINTVIIRTDLSNDPSFSSYLGQVRGTALEALENQDLPFEYLVHHLKPERDPGRNPLFQVNFNHHRCFVGVEKLGDATISAISSRSPGTIFDVHFLMVDQADRWRVSCDFSTDLFDTATAWRMLGHYQKLLEEIAANPDQNISEFKILTDSEKHTLLHEWSGKITPIAKEMTVVSLFLETARNFPQRIALSSGETFFTYRQLHAEAAKVASQLCAQNIQPRELVGICTQSSPETIIGLLGILLAGGAYVPLDPDYPSEHFATLLEESGIKVALATESCDSAFKNWHGSLLRISESGDATQISPLPEIAIKSNDPAYLMFTSGSTGKPKGVIVPHRGITRLVKNSDFMQITHEDVFLHAAPLSFDASTLEIWGPLLNGGRLVLPPPKATLDDIAYTVRECGVTTLWLTSGLFQVMVEEHLDSLKGLRHLLAGGDVLSIPHIKLAFEALPRTRIINGYGPTENTTFTTCHNITSADLNRPSIPIGKPIHNTTIFILDAHGRPTPIGIPGELHTGGDGLAIGYHGDAALTAEKFIIHPEFGRLYKTGDLCRWLVDGTIEIIGRRDHQVKVRGHRIELGEIEKALLTHPGIRQVKFAIRGNGAENKRILGWMISAGESTPELSEIRSHLASHLPQFMQPDGLAFVTSFPINANGKIDLSTLPDPGMVPQEAKAKSYSPPANVTEQKIAALWTDLLGVREIGRDDDFFELGGHSLMALRLFSRINREYGKSLPLAALLKNSTLAALSALVCPVASQGDATAHHGKSHLVTLAEGKPGTPPLVCIHGGDGGVLFYRDLAKRMPENLPVHAIESLELGKPEPITPSTVSDTSAEYVTTLLEMQPEGPFRLVGYSFGGIVAQEMACQLVEMGHKVEFVGLFDTHNPATKFRKYRPHERLSVFWQQYYELPFGQRFSLLRARIFEGIATHRRVRAEIAAANKTGPAEPFSDLRRVQVREENWRAMQEHRPRSFPGKLILFKAISGSDKFDWPVDYGWNTVAAKGLEIIFVPGQHLTLFEPQNIESLAAALIDNLSL